MSEPLPIIPTGNDAEPSRAAEKQRRYRERKKTGGAAFRGQMSGEQLRRLIEIGWIDKREIGNPLALGADLLDIADCHLRGTLDPPLPDTDGE